MGTTQKHIFIVAGETSGDTHASHLVKELLQLDPTLKISGIGGERMRQAGVSIFYDLTQIAVIGFWEVLKHYPTFQKAFNLFLKKVDEKKPSAVILIDYPGFNLRLAKELKKRNVKVIYYISPQVWAWKESRVKQIKKHIDLMLVLFKFEVDFYRKHDFHVEFVGNPVLDQIHVTQQRKEFLESIHLFNDQLTIGLLPGSRKKEVESLLPVMLEAAHRLSGELMRTQYLILQAPTIEDSQIKNILSEFTINARVVRGHYYDALNACNVCLVASGTATLETAVMGKPMVVLYKTSPLTYLLAKMFIKIPNIALVNVVAGKKVVPECLQDDADGETVAQELKSIVTNEIKIADIKSELKKVKDSLGEPGASRRAAKKIVDFLEL